MQKRFPSGRTYTFSCTRAYTNSNLGLSHDRKLQYKVIMPNTEELKQCRLNRTNPVSPARIPRYCSPATEIGAVFSYSSPAPRILSSLSCYVLENGRRIRKGWGNARVTNRMELCRYLAMRSYFCIYLLYLKYYFSIK